ncbi:MAG TPA: hypothetical protein VIN73_12090 [Vicingaceae bacterium]
MTKEKSTNENLKRDLNAVDRRFLKAADILIATGRAKSHSEICTTIGADRSIIAKMKSKGRSITIQQLEATITTYGLNSEFFFYEDRNLFVLESNRDTSGVTTNGDNNKIFHVGQGNIEGNVLYEQVADQIINQAPPELHDKINTLVQETGRIKKMAYNYQQEIIQLKAEKGDLQRDLHKTNKELHRVKDELLNVFRSKNS